VIDEEMMMMDKLHENNEGAIRHCSDGDVPLTQYVLDKLCNKRALLSCSDLWSSAKFITGNLVLTSILTGLMDNLTRLLTESYFRAKLEGYDLERYE
jgi:hypothetical protein